MAEQRGGIEAELRQALATSDNAVLARDTVSKERDYLLELIATERDKSAKANESAQGLESTLSDLNAELADMRAANEAATGKSAELEAELAKLNGERDSLSAELESLNGKVASMTDELAGASDENESLKGRIEGLDGDMSCLLYTSPSPRDS